MHELSLAYQLVEIASEAARGAGASAVSAVYLRLGALAGVVEEALRFGFEIAAAGTPLEKASLHVENVPVRVFCAACGQESALPDVQAFTCPACGAPTADLRAGREIEITYLEIVEEDETTTT